MISSLHNVPDTYIFAESGCSLLEGGLGTGENILWHLDAEQLVCLKSKGCGAQGGLGGVKVTLEVCCCAFGVGGLVAEACKTRKGVSDACIRIMKLEGN